MSAVVSIPRYPGEVTREWLSAALSKGRASVEVSDVDIVPSARTDRGDLPRDGEVRHRSR